jgi:hypothetical protein
MAEALFKSLLLKLFQEAYEAQYMWLDELSEEERKATGTAEHWSVKDHLAHVTSWRQRGVQKLEATLQGEDLPHFLDFDEFNAQTFQEQHPRPAADILRDSVEVYQRLIELVQCFSEEDLAIPGHFAWVDDSESLGSAIIFNGYGCPLEDLAEYYLDHGDLARAIKLHEGSVECIMQLPVPDSAKGTSLYNLSCFYSTHNMTEKALEKLHLALDLYPVLREWALNDPDLVLIRNQVGFT